MVNETEPETSINSPWVPAANKFNVGVFVAVLQSILRIEILATSIFTVAPEEGKELTSNITVENWFGSVVWNEFPPDDLDQCVLMSVQSPEPPTQ